MKYVKHNLSAALFKNATAKKREKIIMVVIIGLMCMLLTTLIVVQFRTIDPENVNRLGLMREEELRTETALLRVRQEEVMERVEETNEILREYQETIASGAEASEIFDRELRRVQNLAR